MKNDCAQCPEHPFFCYHDFGILWNNEKGHNMCCDAAAKANEKLNQYLKDKEQYELLKARFGCDTGPEPVCTCPPTGPIGVCMFCKSDTEKLIKDIAHEDD